MGPCGAYCRLSSQPLRRAEHPDARPAPGLCVGARGSGVESAPGCASASRGSGIAAWFPRLICSQARGRQIVLGGSVEFSLRPGAGSFWLGSRRASRCSCPNACEHMNTAHHCLLLSPRVEMPCFATAVNAKVLSLCVFLILLCFVSSFFQST